MALLGVGVGAAAGSLFAGSVSALAAYFARRVVTPNAVPEESLAILAVVPTDEGQDIILPANKDSTAPGRYSLFFSADRGHARLGEPKGYRTGDGTVTRPVEEVYSGRPFRRGARQAFRRRLQFAVRRRRGIHRDRDPHGKRGSPGVVCRGDRPGRHLGDLRARARGQPQGRDPRASHAGRAGAQRPAGLRTATTGSPRPRSTGATAWVPPNGRTSMRRSTMRFPRAPGKSCSLAGPWEVRWGSRPPTGRATPAAFRRWCLTAR